MSSVPTHGDTRGGSSVNNRILALATLSLEHIEKPLRLTVNPVQVFKDQDAAVG